jgi:hypothetical protein
MNSVTVNPTIYSVEVSTKSPANISIVENALVVTAIAEQGPRGPAGESGTDQLANTAIVAGDGISGGGL